MKKNSFLFLCSAMLASTLAITFTSCSSDDDGGSGAPDAGNSVITNANGDRLHMTSDGVSRFYYNSEGLPTGIYDGYHEFGISFNTNEISGYGEHSQVHFSLNGAGYLSGFHAEEDNPGNEHEEPCKYSSNMSYSYDGNGHLVRVSGSESGYYIEDGEKCNSSCTEEVSLTWSGNKLVKVTVVYKGYDDGEYYTENEQYTYEYDDAYPNPLGQFSHSMLDAYCFDVNDLDILAFFGMYGKPSSAFPTKVIESWSDSDDGDKVHSTTYKPSYRFNNDGTLSYEVYHRTYNYSYSNSPVASAKAAIEIPYLEAKKNTRRHGIFRSHRAK